MKSFVPDYFVLLVYTRQSLIELAAHGNSWSKPYSSRQDVKLLSNDAPIRRVLNDSKEHKGRAKRPDTNRKRLVRFNSIVTEKRIASHKKYSDRMKRALWSNSEESKDNAYRNRIEFQAEGMDWQSVLENDEMYIDVITGELIHPFWVERDDSNIIFWNR